MRFKNIARFRPRAASGLRHAVGKLLCARQVYGSRFGVLGLCSAACYAPLKRWTLSCRRQLTGSRCTTMACRCCGSNDEGGPMPRPLRPIQFALAQTPEVGHVTVDADVMPLVECFERNKVRTDTGRRHQSLVRGVSKQNLPVKNCVACGRPFTWRKRWERAWDNVRYCSDRCRVRRQAS